MKAVSGIRSFLSWMNAVDAIVEAKAGVSVSDLPDIDYVSMYEDGVSPKAAAKRAVRYAKDEE